MKIPHLKKKPELKSCHGVEWEDNYSWIHQENILEVLKDNSKLLPEVRQYLEEEKPSGYIMSVLRDIVKNKSAKSMKFKDGSMKVDMTTANMMLQVLDKINPMNKKKVMGILDKGGKGDFMKVHNVVMKALG